MSYLDQFKPVHWESSYAEGVKPNSAAVIPPERGLSPIQTRFTLLIFAVTFNVIFGDGQTLIDGSKKTVG